MTRLFAAAFAALLLFAATAANAKCEKGHVNSGGMCLPCPDDNYVKGNACTQCKAGFEPNKARTGCAKVKAPAPHKCEAGHVSNGGMCLPCPADTYVKGTACTQCKAGFEPNKARTGCAKVKAPAPHKCHAGEVYTGGMCMPCDGDQVVKAGKCKTCPAGTKPNAARNACAKRK